MARTLTSLASMFLRDKEAFRASLKSPVLIWKAPPSSSSGETWHGTASGASPAPTRPQGGEAIVFQLEKDPAKKNAFAMGITIGRIETNDIAIDDRSVSRFHAWVRQEAKGGWIVSDAESKNGTYCDGTRVGPNQKVAIKDKSKLRFGDVEVTFLGVEGLFAMMEEMMSP